MPIGVAGTISTLHFDAKMLRVDLPFLFVLSGVVLMFFATKRGLQKYQAAIILALYCGYAIVRISNA
jgi:Ca2+/Na+ antiporter